MRWLLLLLEVLSCGVALLLSLLLLPTRVKSCRFTFENAPLHYHSSSSSSSSSSSWWNIRGGAEASSSSSSSSFSSMRRPFWLDMNHDKLQGYMELAKQRHAKAIANAQQSYYYNSNSNNNNNNNTETMLPVMESYGIELPLTTTSSSSSSSWSLPDFGHDFNMSRMIYVTKTALFTPDECQQVIQDAESHFDQGPWTTLPSGRYNVAGFWIQSVPKVHTWFNHIVQTRLVPLLVQHFPNFVSSVNDLVVDNAYLFKYNPHTGRRTDIHTDSGCLSFTIALNSHDEYQGGGTWFQGLTRTTTPTTTTGGGQVIDMEQGQVTIRPGGIRHCGQAVKKGTRYIIGGFCMHRTKVEYVRMLIGLGADRVATGDLKGAQEALEAAIYLNPNFDSAYANLANVLTTLGDTDKARLVLEHCHYHVNPLNAEVAYTLGVLYLNSGDYEKCKSCINVCLQVDDSDEDAIMAMAQACSKQGSTREEEEQWYQRFVNLPDVSPEAAAAAYCNWGGLYEGTPRELELYLKGIELAPHQFTLRYSLASAQAAQKNWTDAARNFQLAVDCCCDDNDLQRQGQALFSLYRVAVNMVQQEFQDKSSSQAVMLQRIQNIMGAENYAKLAASRGQS